MIGVGNLTYDIMFVDDFMKLSDFRNQTVMRDETCTVFNHLLNGGIKLDNNKKLSRNDFYLTYLVKDHIREKTTIKVSEWKEYYDIHKEVFIKEIEEKRPKIIIALGARAIKQLCNQTKVVENIGEMYDLTIDCNHKCKVMPCYSPIFMQTSYDRNNTSVLEEVESVIIKAIQYCSGNETVALKHKTDYRIVKSVDEFNELIQRIKITKICCFDFETTGTEWFNALQYATILSISYQPGCSYIIPLYHFESKFEHDTINYFFYVLEKEIFNNKEIRKIAHNLKFDLHWLMRYGIKKFDGRFDDTMLMSHLLDENTPNGLKDITRKYYNEYASYESDIKDTDWDKIELDRLSQYAAIDTDMTFRLCFLFENILLNDEDKDKRLYKLYRNLIIPGLFSLLDAEHQGMFVDLEKLISYKTEISNFIETKLNILKGFNEVYRFEQYEKLLVDTKKLNELEEKYLSQKNKESVIAKRYKETIDALKNKSITYYKGINFDSPLQLGNLLYNKHGFKFPMMYDEQTKDYKKTTEKAYLQTLNNPFISELLTYRTLKKLLSTYYEGIESRLDLDNNLHTSFLLHGTVTGRLSSRNPNMQNLPSRASVKDDLVEYAVKGVKKLFTIKNGILIQADYSQAELHVAACLAKEDNMIEIYNKDFDIHSITAASTMNKSYEEFNELDSAEKKRFRNLAKGINFGFLYGMQAKSYVDYIKTGYGFNVTDTEAELHRKTFFKLYPKLHDWHKLYEAKCRKFKYVRTMFGRKRRLPEIDSKNMSEQSKAIRNAINSPVQGTAGEFTVFALGLLKHRLPKYCKFVNTVHDSIIFYLNSTNEDDLHYCLEIIRETCETPPTTHYFNFSPEVRMKIDIEFSNSSWGDL